MTVVYRIYRPAHVKETIRFNGRLISCTEASASMLIDASTLGKRIVSQQRIRALSTEPIPDPKSPGLNLHQIDLVMARLGIPYANREGDSWAEFVNFIREGRRATVQLDNGDLHDPLAPADVAHCIFIQAFNNDRTKLLGNNPLASRAEWYPVANVRRAMDHFAKETGMSSGLRFGVSRKVPKIAVNV